MKMQGLLQKFIFILFLSIALQNAFAAPRCGSFSSKPMNQPTVGTNLRPHEWLGKLKLKIKSSKVLQKFDEEEYQEALVRIKETRPRVEEGFIPKSVEEYTAYLDVSLGELQVSIVNMEPILRQKVYKILEKVLRSKGQSTESAVQNISNLIFRASYQKPTSFHFLLTHIPKKVGTEMFVQNVHILALAQVVAQAFNFNPGPQRPGMLTRMNPQWIRESSEILSAGFWTGIGIASSVCAAEFIPFLAPFNILKMKSSKEMIETSLLVNGPDKTIELLGPEFLDKNQLNYYYAVVEKSLNWYLITYILTPLFL